MKTTPYQSRFSASATCPERKSNGLQRFCIAFAAFALLSSSAFAQFAVTTNGGSGLAATYPSLAAAITALNAATITSPVVITCPTGTETAPSGGYSITATGTVTNTITIQGNGAANSIITAPAPAGTVGNLNDAIFKLIGADFITIQGFAMNENVANIVTVAASNTMVEWGVALLYATTTNGCQNVTIQNNTIDLDRTYQNTFGIYSNSTHTATAVTTSATATGATGGNHNLKVYTNNITDVNNGIVVVGPTAAADNNDGVDIGGTTAGTANNITNFGTTGTFSGYANVSATVNGILVRNAKNINISRNTITSSNGGTTVGTLNGIQLPAFSIAPTGTFTNSINNNTLSLRAGAAAIAINGINILGTTASATSTININNNDFNTCGHTVAGASGAIAFISHASSTGTALNQNISNNTFTNLNLNTTGSVTFIRNDTQLPAGGSVTANSNSIVTAFNKTGAGGTVTLYLTTTGPSSPVGTTKSEQSNNFSNITLTGATTMAGWTDLEGATGGGSNKTISGNTFSNWTCGSNSVTAIQTNFSGNGTSVSNNTISNITNAPTATGATLTGISIGSSNGGATETVANNSISGLSSTGTGGQTIGILGGSTSITTFNINGNTVSGISTTATASVVVAGIFDQNTGATTNIFKNKVYDVVCSPGAVIGINSTATSATNTINVYNNIIGRLYASTSTFFQAARGLLLQGTVAATYNVFYNTVYLDGTTPTQTYCVYIGSTVANVPNVNAIDNIFANNVSSSNGPALPQTSYFRFGTTTGTNLASTTNNNVLYAGTPAADHLIYVDGAVNALTNPKQTLGDYKAFVTPREGASSTGLPPFLNTTNGALANYLHIDPAIPTSVESGGTPITSPFSVTDDYDGDARNATTPDVGADEFNGTPQIANDMQATAFIDPTNGGSKIAGATFSPQASFTNGGSASQTNVPVRYRIIDSMSVEVYNQTSTIASIAPNATTTVTFPSLSLSAGTYTMKAKAELVGDAVPANDEITGTFSVEAQLSGTYTVGTGGNYPTLTQAVNKLNTLGISSSVTLNLIENATRPSAPEGVEAYPITINAIPGASSSATVTIKPNAAGITMTGSSASALIILNGSDWVTIDGSSDGTSSRDLTMTNTSTGTSSAVIWLQTSAGADPATNNTIKNLNLVGTTLTATNGTLFGVGSGGTTISITSNGAFNNSNTFQNNNISKTQYGIYSAGLSAAQRNVGNVITQNVMNAASPNNLNTGGIFVRFEDQVQITQNDISVLRHDGTTGLTGTAFGIALGVVPSNSVTVFTGSDVTNAVVSRNKINGVTQLHATGYSAFGIVVNSVTSGTTQVANNMISGVRAASTASDFSAGIVAGGGTGSTTQVYFNSVSMTGSRNAASYPSYGLAINSGDPIVNVRDNIFSNTQSSTSTGKMYAIASGGTTFVNLTSNHNDIYVSGTNTFVGQTGGLGTAGTDRSNQAAWFAATGRDSAGTPDFSISVDPLFASATDLHVSTSPVSPVNAAGTPIAGIATDFDGQTRSATLPDIGADEITISGTLQFSLAGYGVNENGGNATLTVTRTGGSDGMVGVTYNTSDNTAMQPGDYTLTSGMLSWNDGDSASQNIMVPIADDMVYENTENFMVTLSAATGGAIIGMTNPATVTITDNDTAPDFTIDDVTMSEGNMGTTMFQFTVHKNNASSLTHNVDFQTMDGSATLADNDYQTNTGTLIFGPADTMMQVTVLVNGDPNVEPNETFTVNLSNATNGATISDPQATGTITNDDVPPSFSINDVTQAETNAGQTAFTFTVTKSGVGAATVDFQTSSGSATSPSDFDHTFGTLTFLSTDTTMPITVMVNGDTTPEPNEAFFVNLSNAVNATISDNQGLGTITNDDGSPATVYVDDDWASVPCGQDPDGGGPATSMCFDAFATIQGGIDGVANPGTVIVYAGNYPQTSGISLNKVILLQGPNAGNSPNSAVQPGPNVPQARVAEAVITGGGGGNPVLRISATPVTIEGFEFNNAGVIDCYDPAVTATIRRNIYHNGIGGGAFYFLNAPVLVTIDDNLLTNPAGDGEDSVFIAGNWNGTTGTAVSITNNVWADPLVGSTSSTGMNLSNVSGNITGNEFSNLHYYAILLANNSGNITFSGNTFDGIINPSPGSVPTWGAGVRFFQPAFMGFVNIKSNLFTNSYCGVGVRGVPNDPGADITGQDIHVNFNSFINNTYGISDGAAGTLDTENNWWGCNYGPGATGTGCSGTTNGIFNNGSGTVDADPWIVLGASALPNPINPGGMTTVTADMTHNSNNMVPSGTMFIPDVAVAFTATEGTMNPTSGTIMSGQEDSTFTSTSNNDGTATATVNGQMATTVIDVTQATFSIDDVTQAETDSGQTMFTFTVTKNGSTPFVSTVDYMTQDGSATLADNDYQQAMGTLTFQPTDTMMPVTVLVNGDTKFEANETFTVELSNPTVAGDSIAGGVVDTGTGTITNDDTAPSFAINDVTMNEGDGGTTMFTFTVTKTGTTGLPSSVEFQTMDGSATLADNDYQQAMGTLSFGPTDTTMPVTVLVNGDTTVEPNETFTVNLSNAMNATISDAQGTGTITNDDVPSFSINDVTMNEGNTGQTMFVFTVTKTGNNGLPSSIEFQTMDGSATLADNDYQQAMGTLNFGPTDTMMQVTVLVNGDFFVEPNETFTVNLSNPINGTISDGSGTGTITNDDAAPPIVYVDDDWASIPCGQDPDGMGPATAMCYDAFATIQGGVNGVADPGTVIVYAGTYPEAVTVNKMLTINGAKAGQNANTRFAAFVNGPNGPKADPTIESVLTAAATAPNSAANDTLHVMANNVTFNGFVVDGNNPALPQGGAIVVGGINTDSRRAIQTEDAAGNPFPANNVTVSYNVIQNFSQRGVELIPGTASNTAPATTGSVITQNLVRNFGLDGIVMAFNAYADVTFNTVDTNDFPTEAGIWVQDFLNTGTPHTMNINNNNVTVGQDNYGGIWVNLAYLAAININNNTVNAAAGVISGSDFTYGIYVTSLRPGTTAQLDGNTVGASGGQFDRGIALWNVGTTPTSTTVKNGSVKNSVDGISLVYNDANFGPAGSSSAANVSGMTVTASSVGMVVDGSGSGANTVTMTATNSTLSGNSAANGGGITSTGTGGVASTTVTNSTLSGNSPSGASVLLQDASLTVGNTIFNAGGSGTNISALGTSVVSSLGYNLSSDGFGGFLASTGDQIDTDPMLGPLMNNGGPTFTHAPLGNSPAIDQGKDIGPVAPAHTATGVDQRGSVRPVNDPDVPNAVGGDGSDIGAVELAVGVHASSASSRKTHGGAGDFDVSLPLIGPVVGSECRGTGAATNLYKMIVNFETPVTFSGAAVTDGTGMVTSTMIESIVRLDGPSGTQVTINLSGVTDVQTLTVALFDVDDGMHMGDVGVRMHVMIGDVTANGAVNSSDVASAKAKIGHVVDATVFRADVNANGTINSTDVTLIKSKFP